MKNIKAAPIILCSAILVAQTESFAPNAHSNPRSSSSSTSAVTFHTRTTTTVLFPHTNPFGAYDASASKEVSWTPSQAAEFVIYHAGDPKQAGMQLSPMIQDWSGSDLGEFLTRLFLGELVKNDEGKVERVSYCPSNVRDPKWKGLDEDGVEAMKELLLAALPDEVLSAAEMSRCGQAFLLREHRWPKENSGASNIGISSNSLEYETDSFASRGHSADFAKILGHVRSERMDHFTPQDVIQMISLREYNQDHGYFQLTEFWNNLGIQMTPSEKIETVSGMALAGWAPSNIAQFVCSIEDLEGERIIKTPAVVAADKISTATATTTVTTTSATETTPVSTNGAASKSSTPSFPSPAYIPAQAVQVQNAEN